METKDAMEIIKCFVMENNNFETIYYKHRFANKEVLTPRFIVETEWSCNIEHMIDKWHEAQRKTDCYGWFTAFFGELDTDNRIAFTKWLLEHKK